MKQIKAPTNLILMIGFIGMMLTPSIAFAGVTSKAKVLELKGQASYMKSGTSDWEKLDENVILEENDSIKTGPDSSVKLELTGMAKTAEINVGADTLFHFDTFQHNDATNVENTLLSVDVGRVLVKAEKLVGDSKFEVKTPTSIVGIRGTVFEVNVPKAQ